MADAALAKKLQIKSGFHALVLDAPDGYVASLRDVSAGVVIAHRAKGHFDLVLLFVRKDADVAKRVPVATRSLKPGGILWICWPKGTSKVATDLNRDILREACVAHGLQAVASVSIDDTWSALRFKPL